MRAGCFLFFLALLLSPSIAKANIWNSLFGLPGLSSCGPDDYDCLLDIAHKRAMCAFENREYKPNISGHVKTARKLLQLTPDSDRDSYLRAWDALESDAEFRNGLRLPVFDPAQVYNLARVKQAFASEERAPSENFKEYAAWALDYLFETEPDAALALWKDNVSFLWGGSVRAVQIGHEWVLKNDVESFVDYSTRFNQPYSPRYDVWEIMPYHAARHCEAGRVDEGQKITQIVRRQVSAFEPGKESPSMDMAPLTEAILYCEGESEAQEYLGEVLRQMELDIATVTTKITDEKNLEYVLGVIRSEVGEGATLPFSMWLEKEGRRNEAIEMFAKLPFIGVSSTLGDIQSDGILALRPEEAKFEALLEHQKELQMYQENEEALLKWFADEYEPDFSVCCAEIERVADIVKLAVSNLPKPFAVKAVQRGITVLRDQKEVDPRFAMDDYLLVYLFLANAEKRKFGCGISAETRAKVLSDIDGIEFTRARTAATIDYLAYLDAVPSERDQKWTCLSAAD